MFDYQRVGDGFQKLSQVAGDSRSFWTGRTGRLKIKQPKISPNLVDEHRIPEDRPPTPRMELHTAGHLGSNHHFCWHFIHCSLDISWHFHRKTPMVSFNFPPKKSLRWSFSPGENRSRSPWNRGRVRGGFLWLGRLGPVWIDGTVHRKTVCYPIGSMYGIYTNIGDILMVNVTIYSIHGSYGYWKSPCLIRESSQIIYKWYKWAMFSMSKN